MNVTAQPGTVYNVDDRRVATFQYQGVLLQARFGDPSPVQEGDKIQVEVGDDGYPNKIWGPDGSLIWHETDSSSFRKKGIVGLY